MTQHTPKRPSTPRAGAPARKRPDNDRHQGKTEFTPARAGALACLMAVLDKGQTLDEAFSAQAQKGALKDVVPRDRAFARSILTTCLRRLGQIDQALSQLLDKPLAPSERRAQAILRLGMTEILFLKVPAHAAVANAVALADYNRGSRQLKGLVNAVLRRAVREADEILEKQDAARLNTPDDLWQGWVTAYGEETTRAIATAHLGAPPLDLTLKTDPLGWSKKLKGRTLTPSTLRLTAAGPITELTGFNKGAWWVQDLAASLPAHLLGDVKGKPVLDLCAAPGGKTLQLANAGAQVTALDRSASRLARVKQNLERAGLTATLVQADALAWGPSRAWPFVLLDAPCSATGTLRRHPDLAWRTQAAQKDKARGALIQLQADLLDKATALLLPGGTLVYATCSLEPEEGEAQIAAYLARHPDMARAPLTVANLPAFAPDLGDLGPRLITGDGDLRTLPCHLADLGGMDGFYAARLIKSRG